jgi:hypothetical protein
MMYIAVQCCLQMHCNDISNSAGLAGQYRQYLDLLLLRGSSEVDTLLLMLSIKWRQLNGSQGS